MMQESQSEQRTPLLQSARVSLKTMLLLTFAAFHLLMVTIGAWEGDPSRRDTAAKAKEEQTSSPFLPKLIYQAYTGADSGYAFFSPDVGGQLRVVFAIQENKLEKEKLVELTTGQSSESTLRMGNVVNAFWSEEFNEATKRSIAASLAAHIFKDHPQAEKVDVKVQEYYLPSMADYRKGVRPYWQNFYIATFQKRGDDLNTEELLRNQKEQGRGNKISET